MNRQPPTPAGELGLDALKILVRERSVMPVLELFHAGLGPVFRLSLPGFQPIMVAGPEANRFVLVQKRHELSWRPEGDPVAKLLRHGVLIEDGAWHDKLRRRMEPPLHKQRMAEYVPAMVRYTDQVTAGWRTQSRVDMLVEMRRVALLILMDTLFDVDFTPYLDELWPAVLRVIQYISPGPWLVWRDAPRPGYGAAIRAIDQYLYKIISRRRATGVAGRDDLLSLLVGTPWMSDGLIRDQLLTMLIAGHDTSTALLAWSLYLLGQHPEALAAAQAEVEEVIGRGEPSYEQVDRLTYLDQVVKEALRLYPPIHVGTRRILREQEFSGCVLPEGERLLYSIYLSHRDPDQWEEPHCFRPERFQVQRGQRTVTPYSYVPFGGGPRNCIGAIYGQVETKAVLARVLQTHELALEEQAVHMHMGATLEPRPGVFMRVQRR